MPVVRVRAPATTANLGSGFDALGMALTLWNTAAAVEAESTTVTFVNNTPAVGADDNLILRSARELAELTGRRLPPIALECANAVPFGRGLGSSAAAICSGLLIANRLLGNPLQSPDILELAVRIEGHPDNVAPCLLGGAQVAVRTDSGKTLHVAVPLDGGLAAVVFVPDQRLSTEQARAALPRTVPFQDATFNVGRAALTVASLATGERGALAEALRDRLHQPYRAPLFPAGARLIESALEAGALGACVSGAGPSILALCEDVSERLESIVAALEETARAHGVDGACLRLAPCPTGAHIA